MILGQYSIQYSTLEKFTRKYRGLGACSRRISKRSFPANRLEAYFRQGKVESSGFGWPVEPPMVCSGSSA
jgi:hypothetical protein